MSDVAAEQAAIDNATAVFTQFVADVEAEIATLQANNPALDLSKLNAIVATAQADDPGPGATPVAS